MEALRKHNTELYYLIFSIGVIDSLLPGFDRDGGIWMSITMIVIETPVTRSSLATTAKGPVLKYIG
jgi:hypothetical protein